jgi:histidinol phosphatase-like enzyme
MINQAISDYSLNRNKLVYVGDEQKDLDAAKNANVLGVMIVNEQDSESEHKTLKGFFGIICEHIS